jgi:cytochrome c556
VKSAGTDYTATTIFLEFAMTVTSRILAVLLAVGLLGSSGVGGQPAKQPPVKDKDTIMKQKLVEAQKILEGLAIADPGKMKAGAEALMDLRKQASWMVVKTPKYETHSNDFQTNLEALKKAAEKKNIDAAALAYVEMTLTCVRCHQYVREEVIGMAPPVNAIPLLPKRGIGE